MAESSPPKNQFSPFPQRLFERGAEAVRHVSNHSGESYFCPLCRRGFGKEALDPTTPKEHRLTKEDVPPKAHPGQSKVLMLTCWPCNNTAGYTVDAEMSKRERQHRFLDAAVLNKGEYEGQARVSIGGVEATVWLEIGPDGRKIEVRSEWNSPEVIAEAQEKWRPVLEDEGKLHLSMIRPVHGRKAKISDLRSAYLLCFAAFGYSWAFQPSLNIVREQILRFEDQLIDSEYFWHWQGWEEKSNVRWIGQMTEPVRMFHVRLGRHSITLPGIGAETGFYARLAKHFSPGDSLKAEGLLYPWPLTLVAQLDFSIGENKGSLRSAREKVWPGEQTG